MNSGNIVETKQSGLLKSNEMARKRTLFKIVLLSTELRRVKFFNKTRSIKIERFDSNIVVTLKAYFIEYEQIRLFSWIWKKLKSSMDGYRERVT